MAVTDEQIKRQLRLGEDSGWEFKQVEFKGDKLVGPRRDDLADELCAFANANGGVLLCGVSDNGEIQGMSAEQLATLDRVLVEVCTDAIDPPLRIEVHHREIAGKSLIVAETARGDAVHERSGRAFIRVGGSKHQLSGDERLRLAQQRAQGRYIWFDKQIVPETGFESLDERLWEPLLSAAAADDPVRGLTNLRLLARDDAGVVRATNAGLLLCAKAPQDWLPQAVIVATCYRGEDRSTEQLDAKEIAGPLTSQIADAAAFVARNMRVASRKTPAREDLPEYSMAAVFEAIVNAVVHRDYSMAARRIRLSMFSDRFEIDSPGQLPNGMTIEGMTESQATRNEVLASVFGRIPVGQVSGSDHRRYLMERRGDGVSIIFRETRETAGADPQYRLVNHSNLVLSIPAAALGSRPADANVVVRLDGEGLQGIEVLVLFPNKTWHKATTDGTGMASFDLHNTELPMTVYFAAAGYAASLTRDWIPASGDLVLDAARLPNGGARIFAEGAGDLPGLSGRIEPIRDASDRTYLYAHNIAIDQGRPQPTPFRLGNPIRLTDASGAELMLTIIDIQGRCSLLEYRQSNDA